MIRALAPDSLMRLVETFDRNLATTDKQIDALVNEVYGLTEGEMRIVECADRWARRAGACRATMATVAGSNWGDCGKATPGPSAPGRRVVA
ncbi:MAG: hypothetical protein R6X12_09085 [bacterium]